MSTVGRALELGAIPSLTAAGFVYLTDLYVFPSLKIPLGFESSGNSKMILGLVVRALAIYLGIIVGNMINNAVFG